MGLEETSSIKNRRPQGAPAINRRRVQRKGRRNWKGMWGPAPRCGQDDATRQKAKKRSVKTTPGSRIPRFKNRTALKACGSLGGPKKKKLARGTRITHVKERRNLIRGAGHRMLVGEVPGRGGKKGLKTLSKTSTRKDRH